MREIVANPRQRLIVFTLGIMLLVGGCTHPPRPQLRSGSLPYPGFMTLYETVDPEQIDPHSYDSPTLFRQGSKGILYTERGGFIDMAHVRWVIDWAWYYREVTHAALSEGESTLLLPTDKPSRMRVRFTYPDEWDDLSDDERAAVIDELSLRVGQEMAWILGHWHEIATFYGYATLVVVSEHESAFAYCDTFSHVVGLHVFEQAMREADDDFDAAVTEKLASVLESLEPRNPDGTLAAVNVVEGRWWNGRKTLRRQLDLAMAGGEIRPWLIPESPDGPGHYGEPWPVPGLHDLPSACREMVHVVIEPRIWQADAIRHAAGVEAGPIDPYEHFEEIVSVIRHEHFTAHGADTDRP